ncbi:uncharacterized protein LOC127410271 isoform X2 [Myxocyprinus asiaticus]|uniref:uncharacterized protein LOC127410271 isoform X2 n=1 Tax=Myxocyprinus asiaticus TaxID=70543 RepID=UPI002221A165|nr:uncharacterized protein LOC127410271 isoform X2 [Myxocyprinus asiaticus]
MTHRETPANMSNSRTEVQRSPPSSNLPADHVLNSGAVIFPGAFDQHGCPLVIFPVESQCKLSQEVSREEVSHFIHYCLRLHNKGEASLVSVVVDLRQANVTIARFIGEALLLLEFCRRIIHSVYIVQPKKKDVLKQLGKILTPNGSKQHRPILFKLVFLKDVFELSNYIDKSQLTSSLGGYLLYCHTSWVVFIKEFLSVVNRLPSCISTLQSLAKLPVPADHERLQNFCSVNEARFRHLRRDLGLDDLLKHCECLLKKLHFPENEPCFHAMAGTLLFSHTALEMLHNYNRITAAVEKVELLWQQAFFRARLQLQILHLQREAQQIQEQIIELHREKLQPYRIHVSRDAHSAEILRLEFEGSIYTHAMALVRHAEDVIHTFTETIPLTESRPREQWVDDLERLKENLYTAVQRPYQTLRTVSNFHHTCNRCKNWYNLVLCETFLQDLLWSGSCGGPSEISSSPDLCTDLPPWRRGVETFLRRNPCPEVQELVKLSHLANFITDPYLQHTGKQLTHRCMTLRRLLTSPGSVPLHDLQLALQWQYEYLKGNHKTSDITSPEVDRNTCSLPQDSDFASNIVPCRHSVSQCESLSDLAKWPSIGDCHHQVSSSGAPGMVSATGKPLSLSSFDSGFDGAGSSHLDTRSKRDGLPRFLVNGDSAFKSKPLHAQIHEEVFMSVSDSEEQHEELEFSLKRDATRANIQIVPKITSDSLNLEIKLKRSATLPKNPWLGLPIDDLESAYTVTITPNPSNQQRDLKSPSLSEHSYRTDQSNRSQYQLSQTDGLRCAHNKDTKSSIFQNQDSFEDSELNPTGNVLSSTITDNEDKPSNTVDGEPSLLWDTFDLHNLRRDSFERLDASVNDWVHREQQELKEVEETLDRAAEILQEEESVLAQEVLLDDLLKTEDLHKHWPLWNREDQHSLMSSKDLSESVVIGLDDDSELSSLHSEILKTSEICENCPDSPGLATECLAHVNEPVQLDTRCPKVDRSGILQELKDLQALEEQIMKETLKLDALRCSEAEVFLSEHLSQALVMTQSSYRERERRMMHAHLEEETREVEEMERSLSREMEKARKVRKRSSKGHKVVKCSIMEKNSKLKDLDDELLRNCRLQQQSIQNLESDHYKPLLIPASEQSNPQKSPCSASEESSNDIPQYSATEECPFLRLQWKDFEERASHALPNQAENEVTNPQDLHLASGPLGTIAPSKSVPNTSLSEHCEVETVAASSTQKTNHEQGAFDPGGMLLATPVPAPRSAFPLDGKQTQINSEKSASAGDNTARQGQSESGVSVLYDNITPKSRERTNPPLSKTQGLQMHNSNNNKSPPVQPVLYSDISETQENSTQRECYHEDSEVAGQYLCHVQNKNGVQYDGGGSTRAVCKSPLNQLQLHTFTRQMTDYKTTIVLDTGSGLMKAGFADQDLPTTVFPTVIGHPKYEEIMNGSVDREVYIGHDAQHMRGVLTLKYPIRSGVVRNWDEMEMIWHHAFQQLGVDSEDHPVLLTEAAMNPVQNRQRMVELMFEAFNVPLTFVAMQAVLALYASGRTTGVVFDSGDGVSHSVPVFEGYCLPHAVQHFNLAGADVTLQLQKLLLEQGVCMRTSAEQEIVREIKERCCCVALDYEDEFRSGGTSSQVHYTLPDGQLISLATERFRAPEILFKPELIGRDHYGLHESIFKSILRSDIDLRRSFVGNIVLSGGNTLLSGLPERLQKEMRNMVPADLTECVRVTSPSDRDFSVWCGGAVLANLPAFTSAWIGAEEYEEFGPQIVFRKCF